MVSTVEKAFRSIIDDYKVGNINKEQALNEAESKYKSSLIDIKQELHENFEIFCFYRYAPCDIDEYIMACDRSVSGSSSTERDHFAQEIDRIIKGVETDCKDTLEEGESFHTALNTVYMEVDTIRDLCRKNQEISDLYKECKAEIKNIQQISETPKPQLSEQITSDVVQREIERTLALLLKSSSVLRVKDNYCITKTVPQIWEELKTKKELGKIEIPEIDTIDDFICLYLRDQKGLPLDDAVRVAHNRRTKRTKPDKSE